MAKNKDGNMAKNKDGFVPGQEVTWEQMVAANAARRKAESAPAPITRESIAKMKKGDLVELLEAHGADASGSVEDLRARLVSVMFVDG